MKKEKKKSKKKIVLVIGVCLLLLAIAGTCIYSWQVKKAKEEAKRAKKATETIVQEEPEPEVEEPEVVLPTDENMLKEIDFNGLWATNPDIYAYIEIPDTVISYPVLRSSTQEEDYYLNTNVDGTSGLPGAIYSQQVNNKELTDCNTIIYGHDMLNGSMFAGLHDYENQDFFDSHPYVYIYLPEKTIKYQVFAAVVFSDALLPATYDVTNQDATNQFVQDVRNSQDGSNQFWDSVELTGTDRILTLSTCIGSMPNNRWLVVSKFVEEYVK